jgi:hypothetical protein
VIVASFAGLAASIAATRQREPMLDEKVKLERWNITAQSVGASDTARHGPGDIRKFSLEQQVDEAVETFSLKNRPGANSLINPSMWPPRAEPMVKA